MLKLRNLRYKQNYCLEQYVQVARKLEVECAIKHQSHKVAFLGSPSTIAQVTPHQASHQESPRWYRIPNGAETHVRLS